MTWNKSEEDLKLFLQTANEWHPNIKFDYKIGKSVPFLDILLTNNKGTLSTSVYHKPAVEPYVIPFISDHPRHVFANVVTTALQRAVRYSSTFEAFNAERRHIKLTLLYNGSVSFNPLDISKEYYHYSKSSVVLLAIHPPLLKMNSTNSSSNINQHLHFCPLSAMKSSLLKCVAKSYASQQNDNLK